MIGIALVLKMGTLKPGGRFSEWDSADFDIEDFSDDVACDNVNHWLNVQADPICNYAELRLLPTGANHEGFLIGSFKKIKTKSRLYRRNSQVHESHTSKERWVVVD